MGNNWMSEGENGKGTKEKKQAKSERITMEEGKKENKNKVEDKGSIIKRKRKGGRNNT